MVTFFILYAVLSAIAFPLCIICYRDEVGYLTITYIIKSLVLAIVFGWLITGSICYYYIGLCLNIDCMKKPFFYKKEKTNDK